VLASSFQSHYAQLRFSLVRPAPPIRASALGERLGAFSMRLLVRKFLIDVSQPITNHGGEIYLYKGDGLIAVWRSEAHRSIAKASIGWSSGPARRPGCRSRCMHICCATLPATRLANAGKDTRSIQAYLGHNDVRHTVRYTQTDVSSEKMIRINPHQRAFLATLAVSSRPSRRAFHFASAELVAQALDELRDWAEVNGNGDCRHCQPGEHHLPAWIPTDHHSTLWSNGRV
jgi:hypothetical protein